MFEKGNEHPEAVHMFSHRYSAFCEWRSLSHTNTYEYSLYLSHFVPQNSIIQFVWLEMVAAVELAIVAGLCRRLLLALLHSKWIRAF